MKPEEKLVWAQKKKPELGPPGFCTIEGLGLQKHCQNSMNGPPREEERAKMSAGKKREILGGKGKGVRRRGVRRLGQKETQPKRDLAKIQLAKVKRRIGQSTSGRSGTGQSRTGPGTLESLCGAEQARNCQGHAEVNDLAAVDSRDFSGTMDYTRYNVAGTVFDPGTASFVQPRTPNVEDYVEGLETQTTSISNIANTSVGPTLGTVDARKKIMVTSTSGR